MFRGLESVHSIKQGQNAIETNFGNEGLKQYETLVDSKPEVDYLHSMK